MSSPEKLLPQNIEAEAGVLGSLLIDPGAIGQIAETLHPEDFYREAHREIYRASLDLYKTTGPADVIMLTDELTRRGKLEEVGGMSYVTSLANQVPTSQNVKHYAGIVARTATLRRLIAASGQIAAIAYAEPDSSDALDEAEKLIGEVRTHAERSTATEAKKAPFHLLSVREVMNQPRPDPLIDGYYSLSSTGLTYAPPGVGKTVLLLDQMAHVALDMAWEGHAVKGGHVVYVCAEGQAFLPERLQALMLKLSLDDIPRLHILPARPQLLQPQTVAQLLKTFAAELPEPPVWIAFDTVSQTASGARENDADAMGPYLAAMERIREATGAFVHAIHHTGKDESQGARGSSVFLGNCDTVTYITINGDVCLWKCKKQRGGWAEFQPFGFKVQSLAFDDAADHTGPIIKACEVPVDTSAKLKTPPPQVQAVYDVFCALHREYQSHPESPGGVFYGTWEKECAKREISQSTFKNARTRLKDEFKLIYQPETKGAYYPVGWDPADGTEGQTGANWPSVVPDDLDDPDDPGDLSSVRDKGTNALRGIVPLSQAEVNEEAFAELSETSGRTPKDENQSPNSDDESPARDRGSIPLERLSLCPSCGRTSNELKDYGDGVLRCIVCDVPAEKGVAS